MSFIVKGIDFPEKCGDCPCCVEYDNGVCIYSDNYNTGMYCSAQDSAPDVYDIHEKLNNCPLVEIPSPHGRLIDADRAAVAILMMNNHPCGHSIENIRDVVDWLKIKDNNIAFPTIIEAEVSELSQ